MYRRCNAPQDAGEVSGHCHRTEDAQDATLTYEMQGILLLICGQCVARQEALPRWWQPCSENMDRTPTGRGMCHKSSLSKADFT